ncbi:hypothetical protein [Shewanella sp. UCD-KL21]|nr:hypothetical protein [Shewanella sp. UCD-KL21]
MAYLYSILGWGSPLGIGLFLFFSGAGAGLFFWGLACLKKSQ